jgi:hypothetical protein
MRSSIKELLSTPFLKLSIKRESISPRLHQNNNYLNNVNPNNDNEYPPWMWSATIRCILVSLSIEWADDNSKYCAQSQNITLPSPATATHFGHHPTWVCLTLHKDWIEWVVGCNIHRGVWNTDMDRCDDCLNEQVSRQATRIPLRQTIGYPGDEHMLPQELAELLIAEQQ